MALKRKNGVGDSEIHCYSCKSNVHAAGHYSATESPHIEERRRKMTIGGDGSDYGNLTKLYLD